LSRVKVLRWQTPIRGSFDPQRFSGAVANHDRRRSHRSQLFFLWAILGLAWLVFLGWATYASVREEQANRFRVWCETADPAWATYQRYCASKAEIIFGGNVMTEYLPSLALLTVLAAVGILDFAFAFGVLWLLRLGEKAG
jgi:hypothetical protein